MKYRGFISGIMIFSWLWCLTGGGLDVLAGSGPETIRVSDEKELIRAIGPDRTLVLEPGVYNLAELDGDEWDNPYTAWEPVDDGRQLNLMGVANLQILGAGSRPVKIVIECRFAFVLGFQDCDNIAITNIEAGHTPGKGDCPGGVFRFRGCRGVAIDQSVLGGGGKEGLNLWKVADLKFTDSVVKECSGAIMAVAMCQNIAFKNARFFNNRGLDLISIARSSGVVFQGCAISHNSTGNGQHDLFKVVKSTGVAVKDSLISNNRARFFLCGDMMETTDNQLEGNSFGSRDVLIVAEPKPLAGEEKISGNPFRALERARWGMSRERVKKGENGKPVAENNHTLLYRSKILGLDCTVLYSFAGDGLDRITYRVQTGEERTGVRQFTDFYRLRRVLAREYGEPLDNGEERFEEPLPEEFFTAAELEAEIELFVDPEDVSVMMVSFGYNGGEDGE